MLVSQRGVELLIQREGKRRYAYPDPASKLHKALPGARWGYLPAQSIIDANPHLKTLDGSPWTCGIGITGPHVTKDTYWTDSQIQEEFDKHLQNFSRGVYNLIDHVPTSQNQFDAMVSLAFNIGLNAFIKSTVLRQHRAGDYDAAARAFNLFNKAKGEVNSGLVRRRASEANQYLTPDKPSLEELPPTPEPERSLVKSEINMAAAATTVTATTTAVSGLMEAISGKEMAIVLLVIVGLVAFIVYQRLQQRKGGWA